MPKTPRRPQWHVRLDRYHRFVVKRFQGAMDADRSVILARMIEQWVVDHPNQVEQAGASISEWKSVRDTWVEKEDGE